MNLIQDVLSAASTQPEQDHFARIKLADTETQTPAPPADTAPEPSEITPAPAVQEEPPAVESAEPTASDDVIDAARDLSNYCEAHGSGECCKGCYFFDERREGCKIGLPFAWEV